jgi:hypothetical protein
MQKERLTGACQFIMLFVMPKIDIFSMSISAKELVPSGF